MAKSASKIVQRARASMARAREKERQTTYLAVEKGTGLATSVGLAMLSDKMPTQIANLPTKLLLSAGLYIGAYMSRGNVSRALEAAGDSTSNIYAYLAALKVKQKEGQPWIAGDDDDETGFVEEV